MSGSASAGSAVFASSGLSDGPGRVLKPAGFLSPSALLALAQAEGLSLKDLEIFALEQGFLPERYRRNLSSLSLSDQLALRKSRVLLVGLGGLGGHCLDFLLRLGVGGILAVDGDCFEPSNWNRQLLSCSAGAGSAVVSKVAAAREYAARVNPAVDFEGLQEFVEQERMYELMLGSMHGPVHGPVDVPAGCGQPDDPQSRREVPPFSLVIDALGGLEHRMQLQAAASRAALPLVTAGLAGWSGYVARVLPGGSNPAQFMEPAPASGAGQETFQEGRIPSEELLGTPVLTVAFAASLQIKLALEILLASCPASDLAPYPAVEAADKESNGKNTERAGTRPSKAEAIGAKTLLFDLSTHTVETVQL